MVRSTADKRSAFRALHQEGCFIMPNPWDAGSARVLQHLGFLALGSTSAGFAWSKGRADNAIELDQALAHFAQINAAVDLPLNADFEGGFADAPEQVAANVSRAMATGLAGLSLEDRIEGDRSHLYATAAHVDRIKAARSAIAASSEDVLLVARTELLLLEPEAVSAAIDKLVAFAEAGADCLFAPGVKKLADMQAMVRAVAPKPLSVMVLDPQTRMSDYAEIGVRRLSVGPGLARAVWTGLWNAAQALKGGSFEGMAGALPGKQINELFASPPG